MVRPPFDLGGLYTSDWGLSRSEPSFSRGVEPLAKPGLGIQFVLNEKLDGLANYPNFRRAPIGFAEIGEQTGIGFA